MKRIACIICITLILTFSACSAELQKDVGNLYMDLVNAGKDIHSLLDKEVGKYADPNKFQSEEEYDAFAEKLSNMSKLLYADGKDVLGLVSGITSTDLTVVIQFANEDRGYVVGRLLTSDGAHYAEGINGLAADSDGNYTINTFEYFNLIRSAISYMPNRKLRAYRSDEYGTKITVCNNIDPLTTFDCLQLRDANDCLCGFVFVEREE